MPYKNIPNGKTLETMTETLRSRTAPPTFVPPLPVARPLMPRMMKPGIALALGLGLGATALLSLPQPAVARGWQEAKTATQQAHYRHTRIFADGKLSMEGWSGPERSAIVSFDGSRTVVSERRHNGKRSYDFFDFLHYRGSNNAPPNARLSGQVISIVSAPRITNPIDEGIQNVLRSGNATRSEPQLGGDGVWYDVATTVKFGGRSQTFRYQVRVGTDGRLAEERPQGSRLRILHDYPETIPASTFSPRPQARKVPVIDRDELRRQLISRMRRGSKERFGIRLRLALLDREGKLFVFWTGPAVGEGSKGDVRLPGVRSDAARGLAADLAWHKSPAQRGVASAIGRPMPGRMIIPREKIGSTVTISVPGRGGTAVFRNVEILRVGELRYDREVLGYRGRSTTAAE